MALTFTLAMLMTSNLIWWAMQTHALPDLGPLQKVSRWSQLCCPVLRLIGREWGLWSCDWCAGLLGDACHRCGCSAALAIAGVRCICFLGACFGSLLLFLFFLGLAFVVCLAALHRFKFDVPFCCKNAQRDSRGQRRRLLRTCTLCCVVAAYIMAPSFRRSAASSLVCWQCSADTL